MKAVVRLAGEDSAVRAIGREAVEVLQKQGVDRSLFSGLWDLHQRRRRVIAAPTPTRARSAPGADAQPQTSQWYRVVWGVLLGIGIAAAGVAAVMLGPADRKNQYQNADTALTVAFIAGAVAVVVLLVVAVLRVPDPSSARAGEAITVVVAVLGLALVVYRGIAGSNDDRGFTSGDLAVWMPMMVVILLLCVVVALRCDPVRRRGVLSAKPLVSAGSDASKELRRVAARLADSARGGSAEWHEHLVVLDRRGVDTESIAQAKTMTPSAWLAWLAYDGEIDMTGVVPRP